MKKIIFLSAFLLINFQFISSIEAQTVTKEFIVAGKCDMCQTRIIEATDIKGVKSAEWSPETRLLKVTYKEDKVSVMDICKAIAAVGHDTQYLLAADEVYNGLHACCYYERLPKSESEPTKETVK